MQTCIAPAAEALASATARYSELDIATAAPEEILSVMRGVRDAEIAYEAAESDCLHQVAQYVKNLIESALPSVPSQASCLLDGVFVDCAEAADALARALSATGGML